MDTAIEPYPSSRIKCSSCVQHFMLQEKMLIFVVYRYLYTDGLPESGERAAGSGGERGEGGSAGGGGGKGKEKESKCKGGKGADAKGDEEEATRQQVLEREVLKAADLFRWRRCWSTAWRHSGEG